METENKEIEPRAKILFLQATPWMKPCLQMAKRMFGQEAESIEEFQQVVTSEVKAPRYKDLPSAAERDKQAELILPKTVDDFQAIVITGSPFDSYPLEEKEGLLVPYWKKELIDFVRKAFERKKPILGICFGAQILAEALGGKTEKMKNKNSREFWEVGWGRIKRTMESTGDPIMRGIPSEFVAPQNHHNIVSRLPEGSILLAENEYGVQGFRVEKEGQPVAWGFQFHAERTAKGVEKFLDNEENQKNMENYGLDLEEIRERGKDYHQEVQKIFNNFLKFIWSGVQ